jgi:hypothetical protein
MPGAPRTAFVLLLLAFAGVLAPLVAGGDCDESCGPHCGDCVWCPLAAEFSIATHSIDLLSAALACGSDHVVFLHPARVLDHIPLAA